MHTSICFPKELGLPQRKVPTNSAPISFSIFSMQGTPHHICLTDAIENIVGDKPHPSWPHFLWSHIVSAFCDIWIGKNNLLGNFPVSTPLPTGVPSIWSNGGSTMIWGQNWVRFRCMVGCTIAPYATNVLINNFFNVPALWYLQQVFTNVKIIFNLRARISVQAVIWVTRPRNDRSHWPWYLLSSKCPEIVPWRLYFRAKHFQKIIQTTPVENIDPAVSSVPEVFIGSLQYKRHWPSSSRYSCNTRTLQK